MIPRKFTIFGEEIKVSFVKRVDSKDSLGEWNPNKNVIKINKSLSQDQKEQVFLHEMTHCILNHLSYDMISLDEGFVDRFSKALHQVLNSSK